MSTYFLELPHALGDCAQAIQLMNIRGYISQLHWGCEAGEHTGVMILEGIDSEEDVINILPPLLRPKARVFKLNKYTPEDVEKIHDVNQ